MLATFRQPRWLALAAVTVGMSVLFWWLGTWQWGRWHERTARDARTDAALAAPPAPLRSVMRDPDELAAADENRQVTASGSYRADAQVLQRNPDGRAGYAVLTPLVLHGGGTLLVERGLIPPNPQDATQPGQDVAPPSGDVEVTARLRAPEESSGRTAPSGQVYDIDPKAIAADLPAPVYLAYGELVSQDPAPDPALELPEPISTGMGPNFFYALQWWSFIGVALVGYVVLLRRESAEADTPTEPVPSASD